MSGVLIAVPALPLIAAALVRLAVCRRAVLPGQWCWRVPPRRSVR
jgi:hypothetical protein